MHAGEDESDKPRPRPAKGGVLRAPRSLKTGSCPAPSRKRKASSRQLLCVAGGAQDSNSQNMLDEDCDECKHKEFPEIEARARRVR